MSDEESKPVTASWAVFTRQLTKRPLAPPYPEKGLIVSEGTAYVQCWVQQGHTSSKGEKDYVAIRVPWHMVEYTYETPVEAAEEALRGARESQVETAADSGGAPAAGPDTGKDKSDREGRVSSTAGSSTRRRKGNRRPSGKTRG